jgi:hypothetical protein
LIGKSLADDTFKRAFGARSVINTEFYTIRITEIKFGQISVQMALAAVLIDTAHAAFKDRIIPFDGVSVNVSTAIFMQAVVNALMARESLANRFVLTRFIGHQAQLKAFSLANGTKNSLAL